MFTDEAEIILKAGDGGPGRVSFFPGRRSGPNGGNGGKGGDLYILANNRVTNLNNLVGKKLISAENGQMGETNKKTGANGADLEISLPVGSVLTDTNTSKEVELTLEGQKILICRGGKGGQGNAEFRSASNTTPRYAQKGLKGQQGQFKIIVRMIADFGLIGLPNAGKSSLLNELTNADVKVAPYPFTTLEPNLGEFRGKIIADIPGLIEGASKGKGLGINFLKHIEKVRLLLHCISAESEDVVLDYKIIMQELEEFNLELTRKKQIILLTKSDTVDEKEVNKKVKQLKKFQGTILAISILEPKSIEKLKESLFSNIYAA